MNNVLKVSNINKVFGWVPTDKCSRSRRRLPSWDENDFARFNNKFCHVVQLCSRAVVRIHRTRNFVPFGFSSLTVGIYSGLGRCYRYGNRNRICFRGRSNLANI